MPDPEYPDTMRPIGGALGDALGGLLAPAAITAAVGHSYADNPAAWAAEFERRGKGRQAHGNLWSGGGFKPEPEPERLSPAAQRQLRWERMLGGRAE
jgi:hypothetical protein